MLGFCVGSNVQMQVLDFWNSSFLEFWVEWKDLQRWWLIKLTFLSINYDPTYPLNYTTQFTCRCDLWAEVFNNLWLREVFVSKFPYRVCSFQSTCTFMLNVNVWKVFDMLLVFLNRTDLGGISFCLHEAFMCGQTASICMNIQCKI